MNILTALSKIFRFMKLNKPLYCLTLPGFVFVAGGVHIGLNLLEDFYFSGSFEFQPTALMLLLTIVGTLMTFTGILLHSIAGLIMYKAGNP